MCLYFTVRFVEIQVNAIQYILQFEVCNYYLSSQIIHSIMNVLAKLQGHKNIGRVVSVSPTLNNVASCNTDEDILSKSVL